MKVGDAGEAFFVFETEQEVPEEFATSPLAGPSQTKSSEEEEEIDFLDLAQGGHPASSFSNQDPSPTLADEIGKNELQKVETTYHIEEPDLVLAGAQESMLVSCFLLWSTVPFWLTPTGSRFLLIRFVFRYGLRECA
jgi:hypothetical protein